MRGEEPITQFGRMCRKLGIGLIAASSPQAKGRVERVHGMHQDRLVKKLRRKGIVSLEAVNRVFAERVSGGTQPALCTCRGEQGRLSPARAARSGTGPDFAAGDGAYGERGLGGALRQSFFSTRAAEPELCADAAQSVGVRGTVRGPVIRAPSRDASQSWCETVTSTSTWLRTKQIPLVGSHKTIMMRRRLSCLYLTVAIRARIVERLYPELAKLLTPDLMIVLILASPPHQMA